MSRGERKRKGKEGKKGKHSTIDSSGIERLEGRQKSVSACACDPAHCRLSLCPVNWNTKQSGVDERVVRTRRRRRRGGAAVCLQQRSTFTARWELTGEPASETDTLSLVKWTVTLHFSASWQHRIGRFEPCDVTLIEFWFSPSWALKEEAGLISSVQPLHAKYPGRGDITVWAASSAPKLHLYTRPSYSSSPPLIISLCCFVTLPLS